MVEEHTRRQAAAAAAAAAAQQQQQQQHGGSPASAAADAGEGASGPRDPGHGSSLVTMAVLVLVVAVALVPLLSGEVSWQGLVERLRLV
jgi:hypothetical protein